MWLFPYFMESLIKAVLPSLTMLDYKVTANKQVCDSIAFCWFSYASCTCKAQCSIYLLRVFHENPVQLCIFSVKDIFKL